MLAKCYVRIVTMYPVTVWGVYKIYLTLQKLGIWFFRFSFVSAVATLLKISSISGWKR